MPWTDSAFAGCQSLERICLPAGLHNIEGDVFSGCKMLMLFVFPGSYGEEYAKNKKIPDILMETSQDDLQIQEVLDDEYD